MNVQITQSTLSFSDEFSTLRSIRSHLPDASLQHNYSNISPRETRDVTCQGHVSPLTSHVSHHGPSSLVSSNMSAVSANCNGDFTPPMQVWLLGLFMDPLQGEGKPRICKRRGILSFCDFLLNPRQYS